MGLIPVSDYSTHWPDRTQIADLDAKLGFLSWSDLSMPTARVNGYGDQPYSGVPLLLKDLHLHAKGLPLWWGNEAMREESALGRQDDPLTESLRKLGFDIIGRTKTAEFGIGVTTEPAHAKPVLNPWNTAHSAGGSSGGSACAVASGALLLAHGTDLGGSLRIPAAHCGIVALKPGTGDFPDTPRLSDWNQHGFFTTSVAESRRILSALGWLPQGGPPGAVFPPLRIGVITTPLSDRLGLSPAVGSSVDRAASRLAALGHHVIESRPKTMESFDDFAAHAMLFISGWLQQWIGQASRELGRDLTCDDLEPATAGMLQASLSAPAGAAEACKEWLLGAFDEFRRWWSDFDILLTPTTPVTAPPLGWFTDPRSSFDRTMGLMQYTAWFNATGSPALSVPMEPDEHGLPVGVQIVGRHCQEDTVLAVGQQLMAGPARLPRPIDQG